jgi:eukaryotic-like serine/threonine-protein kinase
MISEEIGTGSHVRILDFGLARLRGAINATATQSHVVVGTPSYMAPEQTVGSTVDARADLYATGVVLFEMITGEKPFRAEDTLELLAMHRGAPVPRLANLVPPGTVIPEGLQEIVDRALTKDPADRYQTAIEFAAAIDDVLAGVAPVRRLTSQPVAPAEKMRVVTLPPAEAEPYKHRRLSIWFWVALLLLGFAAAAYYSNKNQSAAPKPSVAAPTPPTPTPTPTPTPALADAAVAMPSPPLAAPDAAAVVAMPAVTPDAGVADAAVTVGVVPVPVPPEPPDAGLLIGEITLDDAGLPIVEPEPDPETADDPDPTAATAAENVPENEDEAPDAPDVVVEEKEDPKVPPPPQMAKTVAGAVKLIRSGQKELALQSLRRIWPKQKKSAYIPFLLGNLYTDKRWWSVALDHYRIAIRKNAAYKRNGTLNRNVIRMLASKKTGNKAAKFLRFTIGRPSKPHVKSCAKWNKSATVRKKCAWLVKRIR